MSLPESPQPFQERELRQAHEGHVLRVAGESFAVVAKYRQRRVVHLDLEAEDGAHATLIGVPRARIRLCEGAAPPLPLSAGGDAPCDPTTAGEVVRRSGPEAQSPRPGTERSGTYVANHREQSEGAAGESK